LQLDTGAFSDLAGPSFRIHAQDLDGATVTGAQPLNALHEGGLPRTVGADHPEYLAPVNLEGNVVNGAQLAVVLDDMLAANGNGHWSSSSG
jgi:hypothetical protein